MRHLGRVDLVRSSMALGIYNRVCIMAILHSCSITNRIHGAVKQSLLLGAFLFLCFGMISATSE